MMVSDSTILAVINDLYPKCAGAILTGSFLKKTIMHDSDIDIVLIDAQFSVISPVVITVNGVKFDFTQIPMTNLNNILFHELYDTKGILIRMIAEGRIIKDTQDFLIKKVKLNAESFYSNFHPFINNDYIGCLNNLQRIKKQLSRPLEPYERFFLLNEFVYFISRTEVYKHTNWSHSSKHKPVFLVEKNEEFVNMLMEKADFSRIYNPDYSFSDIVSYIDFYSAQPHRFENRTLVQDRLIVDLFYEDISVLDFIKSVAPKIIEDPFLNKFYQYFFLTPTQTSKIYKNTICIVFSIPSESLKEAIVIAFRKFLSQESKNKISISLIPVCIFSYQNPNKDFTYNFELVAKTISKVCLQYAENGNEFDEDRFFSIGIILTSYIAEKLKLKGEDLIKCNYYLSQRWILTFREQTGIRKPDGFSSLRNKKHKLLKEYYIGNQDYFNRLIEKGMSYSEQCIEGSLPKFSVIIDCLNHFLKTQLDDIDLLAIQNEITLSVLGTQFDLKEPKKALLYSLTFENLVRSLNINDSFICLILYTLSEYQAEGTTTRL
jgi:predicted nucleotidyltransferase